MDDNKGIDITPLKNWLCILTQLRDFSREVCPPDEYYLRQRKLLESLTDYIISRLEKELENGKEI